MKLLFFAVSLLCLISCTTNRYVHLDSGLKYRILKRGRDEVAKVGSNVLIQENMSYLNDSLLFSSYKLPGPIEFLVGGNRVIDDVDEGVRGMEKGEIRKIMVPPSLCERMGNQTFPHPYSTLVCEVELIDVLSEE